MNNMIYFRPNCLGDSYPESPLIRMAMDAKRDGDWYVMIQVAVVE